ncbi:serine hydrolase domain-containing protein [Kitasatospora sp. NPDC085879]|uniref:serine hydrolase domain-containing protein n=1 Tax=Kitasatospora sp. NPDC085879 TaxID=3154769 RepID=UPI0034202E07
MQRSSRSHRTHEDDVAVAVIRGDERTVACRGYADRPGSRPVRADSRFELGSVTKTFTALLLAAMVARGEVRYDDPIDRYLPAGSVPRYPRERPITFSAPHLLRALPRTPVRGTPGTQVRYSNLGTALLGLVLEHAAGLRHEDLLAARVCEPLGLIDTTCGSGRTEGAGYRRDRRVPSFRIPALPGAAALHSTADDMLRFLQHICRSTPCRSRSERALGPRCGPHCATWPDPGWHTAGTARGSA